MGIISRDRAHDSQRAGTTVVAAGTKLVGDLALSDNLHIDGHVDGKIRSEAEVTLGQSAQVDGDISADKVFISGQFEGNIEARRLEIVAGGRVNGDVTVSELVIEPGAQFNGSSRIRDDNSAPRQLSHVREAGTGEKEAEKKPAEAAKKTG